MMKLPLSDRSNYYKGLLVLLRRDRIIDSREKELLLQLGKILDFDRRFCEATIDDLLWNSHLTREPIIFTDIPICDCFFRDALRLALVDGYLHPMELSWLRALAHANNRSHQWLDSVVQELKADADISNPSTPFEIQRHL